MSKRDIGQEILEGIREVKAYKAGKKALHVHSLKEPAPPKVIRQRLKLSQSAFAGLMGVSLRTVQDWEQGRVNPADPPWLCCELPNKSQKCLSNCHSPMTPHLTQTSLVPIYTSTNPTPPPLKERR